MSSQDRTSDCSATHPGCQALRREACSQGVTDPENLPFIFCPPGADTAVLLVHGFTATPWEMRPLAAALAEAGIASLAVRLPGHGTTPEDLADRCWEEWLAALHEGYQILTEEFQTIYGMGMSTGCLLLLAMVSAKPLDGLVLFSPYLRVLHRLAPYAWWLKWFWPFHEKPAEAESSLRYYSRRPLAGIHQINRLLKTVSQLLSHVTCPVLAFNGEGDQTVDVDSGRRLMNLLGSSVKIHELYGFEVPHVLTREENPCRNEMFNQAIQFVQELKVPGSTARVR